MKPISLPLLVSALASIGLACGGLQSDTSSVDATAERVDLTVSSADWSTLLANRALYPPPPSGGRAPMPGDHQPPPEAFEACVSHSAGQACSVSIDGHTLNGTCRTTPDGAQLVCAPEAPPPCGPGMPPQELAVPGAIGSDPNSSNNALVWMPPAGPDGTSKLLVQSTTDGYLLVPALDRQPPPGAPPPPNAIARAPRARLFVNHGEGAVDSGIYLRLPPPPAP